MSMLRASLSAVLTQTPGRNTWDKIRKHLNALSGPDLETAVHQVEAVVKTWPALISRPPLKTWRKVADPRLRVCKIVHETATYGDYLKAFTVIKRRNGWQAVSLERQFTGKVQTTDGQKMMIGVVGSGDLKGSVTLEWESGGKFHTLSPRLEVEPKAENGKPSKEQLLRQAAFAERGECMVIAYGTEDAVRQVREWKEAKERELTC